MTDHRWSRAVLLDLDGVLLDTTLTRDLAGPHEVGRAIRPGVPGQLQRLAGYRVACAALTTLPSGWAEELLRATGLKPYVQAVVARSDTARWLPSPVPAHRALQLLRWDGSLCQVAVISDLTGAVTMGRKAQLRTVAVTYGRSSAPDLADAWPDVLAANLPDAVTAALDLTDRFDRGDASVAALRLPGVGALAGAHDQTRGRPQGPRPRAVV
ncbi:HAD family hydrolase [Ornithinimicrobium pratense]|uniref:HAD family hydrolase n=1 Tax=Ornithinimicrobium pratense TaxID=2593973 RepID=A0A5J6V9V7_9MICO|nr:HAD family hydrolase [Ornithinimicrobium pratense]QFG69973.1 HAD family hydrolase [Ornithinimicrobium pratense]